MMTTLRSDRRTRRNTMFKLECLDDRIVLSAASAVAATEAHVAALISSGHVKAAAKAEIILERDEVKLAKVEAKTDAMEHYVPGAPVSPSPTPIHINYNTKFPEASPAATAVMTSAVTATTATPVSSVSSASAVTSTTASPATTATTQSITTPTPTTTTPTPTTTTSSSSSSTSSTTLPPNVSVQLQSLYSQYEAYESAGGSGTFTPTGIPALVISGTSVGINFQTSDSAGFSTVLAQLQSDGLQVTADSATYGLIDGMLPIAQLPTVAQISPSASVTAEFQPLTD